MVQFLSGAFSKHSSPHTSSSLLPNATPNMMSRILHTVNEVLCQSPLIYGAEIWGIEGASEEADRIQGRFCERVLGIPRYAVKGVAELEMCRESTRAKCSQVLVQGKQVSKEILIIFAASYGYQVSQSMPVACPCSHSRCTGHLLIFTLRHLDSSKHLMGEKRGYYTLYILSFITPLWA